ncbi:tetratricopeptide repeat protein, partial [Streptomyces sp. NPDC058232]|uniref:tetratricopeptide repeat protein n=1 Tax=Streptomyces sp. NPDC058232 TaxID=3346393 RepID=UPI0036E25944
SLGVAGRTYEAIRLQEQVLADSERVLGPDHPGTLNAGNNLANLYLRAGRTDVRAVAGGNGTRGVPVSATPK